MRSVRAGVALSLALGACTVAELPGEPTAREVRDATSPDTVSQASDAPEDGPDTSVGPAPDADVEADAADAANDAADAANDLAETTSASDTSDAGPADADPDLADADPDLADTGLDPDSALADSSPDSDAPGFDANGPNDCGTLIATHDLLPSPHIELCSPTSYPDLPPTSGPHYPIWAAFKTYASPVNPGFLVHALEHGAVVINYRCDTPCEDALAALAAVLASRPPDPLCTPPLTHRIIVSPRPDLDVRFAASAWGASLKSECFDLPALQTFLDAHYAQGPEDFCADGLDLETLPPDSASFCPP
jgi:hypothetical protein